MTWLSIVFLALMLSMSLLMVLLIGLSRGDLKAGSLSLTQGLLVYQGMLLTVYLVLYLPIVRDDLGLWEMALSMLPVLTAATVTGRCIIVRSFKLLLRNRVRKDQD